jgi:hypothetical protein
LSGTWRWNGKNSGQCLAILFGFGEIKRNIIRVLTGQLIPAQFVLRRLREYYGGEDLKYLLVKGVNDSGIEEQNVTCNTSTS